MKLSYSWLQSYFSKKLPKPEKLAELLTFHVAEIEKIEIVGNDAVLHVDVLPNRAHDLNSHVGVAGEITALTGSKLKILNSIFKEGKQKTSDVLSVRVEDTEACPRYIGRYIEGVRIAPSPKWLRERLEVLGMRSINNVVDATNYVMLETGQPLHVFDSDEVAAINFTKHKLHKTQTCKEIIIRRAKKGEKFTTLDDQICTLDGSELLIADAEKPLALAGIKGGKKAGITSKTKNLILEAANFDPTLIRRMSKKLGLITDASKLFSGGLHPVLAQNAMERLAALIGKLAGGVVYKDAVDVFPKKWPQVRVVFNPVDCNALLGTSLKETEMKKILKVLGCKIMYSVSSSGLTRGSNPPVFQRNLDSRWSSPSPWIPAFAGMTGGGGGNDKKKELFLVVPPAERLDLASPEDLYEEIGRVYGWERIQAAPPYGHLAAGTEEPIYQLADLARRSFTGMGYSEHIGYSFVKESVGTLLKKSGIHFPELENPLNADAKYLRPMLLPSLLGAVAENAKRRDTIRLFEIGKTFFNGKEQWSLAFALYLAKEAKKRETWYEIKGVADAMLRTCGLHDVVFREVGSQLLYEPQTYAVMLADDAPIGCMAEIAHSAKTLYDIEGTVAYGFIDLEALLAQEAREREFADIPKFPSVTRDIAVLVQKGSKVETVQNVIEREGGELLFDVDLFDVYEGPAFAKGYGGRSEGMDENRESLAFHLVFQSAQRTLRDAEVNSLVEKIVQALKAEGWEIRE